MVAPGSKSASATGNGTRKQPLFEGYSGIEGTFDEFVRPDGAPRPVVRRLVEALDRIGQRDFRRRQTLADGAFLDAGVTFSVYSDQRGGERVFPFDLVPRVIGSKVWQKLEDGLAQRVRALNAFLSDVYGEQTILKEKRIPEQLVLGSRGYLPRMRGVVPPGGVYVHVAGIDLIRGPDGKFLVLEDNARTPSGVSYVLENRGMMKRALPRVFRTMPVRSIDDYPARLRSSLCELGPVDADEARAVVLTPGPFNSAYFEHSFIARRMGCELVHPSDLFVRDRCVYLSTTAGPERVHVIYRRVDDDFLDPDVFREDSLLGVRGIIDAYVAGNVLLANAVGNGVADDKAVYRHVPEMIRFYLSEEPLLDQVRTFDCSDPKELSHVLAHLDELVVKAVDGSGGYGMLMGPTASPAERQSFGEKLASNPRGYVAQPRIELSCAPTWAGGTLSPRRLDLRPFVLTGKTTWVLPGGLSRVALAENSYVVNSSQGGGSKDTWVLGGKAAAEGGTS